MVSGYSNMPQRYVTRAVPVLVYLGRDVQAVRSNSAHAVTKSFMIRSEFQIYRPFKKSRKSRQSFYHRYAQPVVTKVV
jgi:hypothetical protein